MIPKVYTMLLGYCLAVGVLAAVGYFGQQIGISISCTGYNSTTSSASQTSITPPNRFDLILTAAMGACFLISFIASCIPSYGAKFRILCGSRPNVRFLAPFSFTLISITALHAGLTWNVNETETLSVFVVLYLLVPLVLFCLLSITGIVFGMCNELEYSLHRFSGSGCCFSRRLKNKTEIAQVFLVLSIGFFITLIVSHGASVALGRHSAYFIDSCQPENYVDFCSANPIGTMHHVKCLNHPWHWFGLHATYPNSIAAIVSFLCIVTLQFSSSESKCFVLPIVLFGLALILFAAYVYTSVVLLLAFLPDVIAGIVLGFFFGYYSLNLALKQIGPSPPKEADVRARRLRSIVVLPPAVNQVSVVGMENIQVK